MSLSFLSFSKSRSARRWITGVVIVGAIWTAAFAAVMGLRSLDVTANGVMAKIESSALAELSPAERSSHLQHLAEGINRLDLNERTRLRQSGLLEKMFLEMSDTEKTSFLQATLPRGMEQMMESLNAMPPEERRRVVDRGLRSLRRASSEEISRELEDVHGRLIVEEGLKAYFEVTSAETKLEMAPLIEHLQQRLQRVD